MTMSNIVSDSTLIDDQRARLAMWASDVDVFGLDVPDISLEYRLRDNPTLLNTIHDIFDEIYVSLESRKSLIANTRPCELGSRSNDDIAIVNAATDQCSGRDHTQTNDSLITNIIGECITCLYLLRSEIPNPVATSRA
jgi:hypothetical protein